MRVDERTASMLQEKFEVHPIYNNNVASPKKRRSSLVDVFIQVADYNINNE